jgi:hypothetical protein
MTDLSNDLHDLIDRTLADLPTPTDRIRAGAVARGRATRRRHRAGAVLGGVSVAVLVAALVVPSVAGTEGDDRFAQDPSGRPGSHESPAGWWDMPGAVMRDRLAAQLPEALRITDANLGDEELPPGEEADGGWVAIDVADEDGPAGSLNVLLYPPFETSSFAHDVLTCPGNVPEANSCTVERDAQGKPVGRDVRWARQGVVNLAVTRLMPDGAIVYAASSNSSDDKPGLGSSTDRPRPPIGLLGLGTIAEDPTWQDWSPRG